MLAGKFGEVRRWAISHQIAVSEFFDAADFVPVSQAHIMADTESLGETGVRFLEGLAAPPRLSGGCGFRSNPLLPTIRLCKLLGQALSHVQCYVPRNTTRASTAFTP